MEGAKRGGRREGSGRTGTAKRGRGRKQNRVKWVEEEGAVRETGETIKGRGIEEKEGEERVADGREQ